MNVAMQRHILAICPAAALASVLILAPHEARADNADSGFHLHFDADLGFSLHKKAYPGFQFAVGLGAAYLGISDSSSDTWKVTFGLGVYADLGLDVPLKDSDWFDSPGWVLSSGLDVMFHRFVLQAGWVGARWDHNRDGIQANGIRARLIFHLLPGDVGKIFGAMSLFAGWVHYVTGPPTQYSFVFGLRGMFVI